MEDYPHLNEALSHVLRCRREELGLSKLRMSELIHMERAYITQLERGNKRPTLNAVFYICDALQISHQDFLAKVEAEMKRLGTEKGRSA